MNKISVKKGYNLNTPSWESIFENLSLAVETNQEIKHNGGDFFVSHISHHIPEVKSVLEDLQLNYAHSYINLTSVGSTFGRHKDIMDVWHWQVKGKAEWSFDDKTIVLDEGDLIEVPKGIYHSVKPLTPRVGISMAKE